MFDMNEQILITEVNKIRRKKAGEQKLEADKQQQQDQKKLDELPESFHQEQFNEATSNLHILERDIVRILVEFGSWKIGDEENETSVAHYVLEEMDGLDIESSQYKPLYELVKREFAEGNVHEENFYMANDDAQITSAAIGILAQPHTISDNWYNKYKIVVPDKRDIFIKDIASSVIRFKQFKNISELKKIEQRIKDSKDETELMKLMKLHKLLIEQKKEFARTVGNVIYRPTT